MFDNIPFPSLQLLVLMTHFILTTGLVWTKYDCLQVTLRATASKEDFNRINRAYTGLIAFGLILLVFQMVMLTLSFRKVSLFGAVKLFLDVVACFFISWTILDGLEWTTYIYIFVFCVLVPAAFEIVAGLMYLNKNIWVDWRSTRTIFQTLSDFYEYLASWVAYFGQCIGCVAEGFAQPSSLYASCVGCVVWMQTEGISGVLGSCWSCMVSTVQNGPSGLLSSCWASLSSGASTTSEYCSSLCSAFMQGPTGVMEFCTSSLNSCSADDSPIFRCFHGISYIFSSMWSGVEWIGSQLSSCGAEYGPMVYNMLIQLRDFIWSCLMWLWRQVRLFFT